MLDVFYTSRFKKDLKRIKKQGKDIKRLQNVLKTLLNEQPLPAFMKDHELVGNYCNHRECHIEPDWLLIYRIDNDNLVLTATRTESHSDLF